MFQAADSVAPTNVEIYSRTPPPSNYSVSSPRLRRFGGTVNQYTLPFGGVFPCSGGFIEWTAHGLGAAAEPQPRARTVSGDCDM